MRRALASAAEPIGLPGAAAPVIGSMRISEPLRPTGSPGVRRSWARSRPPCAVGTVWAVPAPPGGSPHGFTGLPSWP